MKHHDNRQALFFLDNYLSYESNSQLNPAKPTLKPVLRKTLWKYRC